MSTSQKALGQKGFHNVANKWCQTVVLRPTNSSAATSLQTTLRLHNFPQAILAAIKHVTGDEQLCRCLEPIITQFLQSIRIVAVQNLQTDIILKTREPNPLIGSVKCEFYLQKKETYWCFYLDSKISESGSDLMGSLACQTLAEHLTEIIKTENTDIPYVSFLELQKLFTNLLMAQTPQQVKLYCTTEESNLKEKTSSLKQILLQGLGSPYQNRGITDLTKILTTSSTLKNGWVMRMEKIISYLHKLSIQ